MWISSLVQSGVRHIFILGLASSLAACGGGGGGDTPSSTPASPSSIAASSINSSSSSLSNSNNSSSSISNSSTDAESSASSSTTGVTITIPLPDTPNEFRFVPVIGAALNSSTTSTVITISGIRGAQPISITNGEYSIDGGAFTNSVDSISNGQTVAVRVMSAATAATETQAVIAIGGTEHVFSVTTTSLLGGAIQGKPLNIGGVVTTFAGTPPGADGAGALARFSSPESVATDGSYLYVADTQSHKIRKVEIATGVVTTLAGNGSGGYADGIGSTASFERPRGLTINGNHLYVADTDNNKIRKIEIATGAVSTLAGSGLYGSTDAIGHAASFSQPEGITTDGTYLYVADTYNNKIRKIEITTAMVTTLAGSGASGGADGTGSAALFNTPQGIITDGTYLYIADTYNFKIRKIEMATGAVSTLAGSGSSGYADGVGAAATFYYPHSITTDGINLYVGGPSVRKIVIASGVVTTLSTIGAESGGEDGANSCYAQGITIDDAHMYVVGGASVCKIEITTGVNEKIAGGNFYGGTDGVGAAASFGEANSITTDGSHLYLADSSNNKIRKISIDTGLVSTFAGSGLEGSTDGATTEASFDYPAGITTDGTYLYVADSGNNKIRMIELSTGVVITLAGSGLEGSADGVGVAASFKFPSDLTTDGTYLYVSDSGNRKIRKIAMATGVVTTLAGSGLSGETDGIGADASFSYMSGITTDGVHLYVADSGNNKIRMIEISSGTVATLAGSDSLSGWADGVGAAAVFYNPSGITTDGAYLYVTDALNYKIRKIEITTGTVTTLAGGHTPGSGDGVGAAASFDFMAGITSDGFVLYVVDSYNNTIRKIE